MPRGRPRKADQAPEATEKIKSGKKQILVQAVGRIGYYGDQRRFPVGHGHPRSGEPFWIFENEFSDSSKKVATGLNGWMRRVKKEEEPLETERTIDESSDQEDEGNPRINETPGVI
jgi:hypothetical protein